MEDTDLIRLFLMRQRPTNQKVQWTRLKDIVAYFGVSQSDAHDVVLRHGFDPGERVRQTQPTRQILWNGK